MVSDFDGCLLLIVDDCRSSPVFGGVLFVCVRKVGGIRMSACCVVIGKIDKSSGDSG